MTSLVVVLAAVLGLGVGMLADRAARRFPWTPRKRSWSSARNTPDGDGAVLPDLADRRGVPPAAVSALLTAVLFALVVLRFGAVVGAAGLPAARRRRGAARADRPAAPPAARPRRAAGDRGRRVLLALAARVEGDGSGARCVRGSRAVVLFVVFLVLALISPGGLGMGDVKLAALLGLYLGLARLERGRAGRGGRLRRPGGAGPGAAGHAAASGSRGSCRSARPCCSARPSPSAGAAAASGLIRPISLTLRDRLPLPGTRWAHGPPANG